MVEKHGRYAVRRGAGTGDTLRESLKGYEGKIVRIGTQGSGYVVCGKWSDDLRTDLSIMEAYYKNRAVELIERQTYSLKFAKANINVYTERLEDARKAVEQLQEKVERMRHQAGGDPKERVKARTSFLRDYMERQRAANEEEIGGLHGRAKSGARRSFERWQRRRKKKFDERFNSWKTYVDNIDKRIKEQENALIQAEKKLKSAQQIKRHAEQVIYNYPSKIRARKKYLKDYKPMLDREVLEIYPGLDRSQTSIIIRGTEIGKFWDIEEYDKWKKSGKFYREDSDVQE